MGGAAVALATALVWVFSPEPPVLRDAEVMLEAVTESAATAPYTPAPPPEPPGPEVTYEPAAGSPRTFERSPLPGETPRTPMAELVNERQNTIRLAGAGGSGSASRPNIASVELEFGTEPVDRTWAPSAEAAVFAAFAQIPGLKLIDQQIECRSTMCRIELTQPGAVTSGERVPFHMLGDSIGLTPRLMMMFGAGSTSMRSVGYFWREGFAPSQQPDQPHRSK